MKRTRRILKYLRLLFWIKKPAFQVFEVLDVLVEQKPILLFAWHSERLLLVSIPVIQKHYFKPSGSVIAALPPGTDTLEINCYTFWRSRKFKIALRRLDINNTVAEHLIKEITSPDMLKIEQMPFSVENRGIAIHGFVIESRVRCPVYRNKLIETKDLIYQ